MAATLEDLVNLALDKGTLFTIGASRTITVAGRRRLRIRVQCDIFASVHGRGQIQLYYPELAPTIDATVDAWREAHRL